MRKKVLTCLLCIFTTLAFSVGVKAGETQDTWICEEYQEYIYDISDDYCVSPELIMAIVEHESSGKASIVNNSGTCVGLMQVYEKYHRDRMARLGVSSLYDPYSNILVGVDYLMELAAEYDDLPLVLMMYNGSSDAMKRAETGNYTSYANGIMKRAEELTRIHDMKGVKK